MQKIWEKELPLDKAIEQFTIGRDAVLDRILHTRGSADQPVVLLAQRRAADRASQNSQKIRIDSHWTRLASRSIIIAQRGAR